jgi:hypothetical protein
MRMCKHKVKYHEAAAILFCMLAVQMLCFQSYIAGKHFDQEAVLLIENIAEQPSYLLRDGRQRPYKTLLK